MTIITKEALFNYKNIEKVILTRIKEKEPSMMLVTVSEGYHKIAFLNKESAGKAVQKLLKSVDCALSICDLTEYERR